MHRFVCLAAIVAVSCPILAFARVDHPEQEDNSSLAAANAFTLFTGDSVTGITTGFQGGAGDNSIDYFNLTTASASPAIYRNRLNVGINHTAIILGYSQSNRTINTSSEVFAQISSGESGVQSNNWYTFGSPATINYALRGSSLTSQPYRVEYTRDAITPSRIAPTFAVGTITIDTSPAATDTDLAVYDANFHPIGGFANNDRLLSIFGESTLVRNYVAGTYYLALTSGNLQNDQPAASDDAVDNQTVLRNPGALLSNSSGESVAFTIIDSNGNVFSDPDAVVDVQGVAFYQFTVGTFPEPAGLVAKLASATLMLRRRK